jgi:hypothetical protein
MKKTTISPETVMRRLQQHTLDLGREVRTLLQNLDKLEMLIEQGNLNKTPETPEKWPDAREMAGSIRWDEQELRENVEPALQMAIATAKDLITRLEQIYNEPVVPRLDPVDL